MAAKRQLFLVNGVKNRLHATLFEGVMRAQVAELLDEPGEGDAKAQFSLGHQYNRGEGTPQDQAKAVHYYRLAADQGHAEAQHSLAVRYAEAQGLPRDDAKAIHYFRLAADQGSVQVQYSPAISYAKGQGVPRDRAMVVRYYQLAADQGHADAQAMLAQCFSRREGTPQDLGKAARYFRLAADQGHAGAKLIARAAQSTDPYYEAMRLEALAYLHAHADEREVILACCIGCGKTEGLNVCTRCKAWQGEQQGDESQQ
ncbi:hypothetical protein T492DRAFT_875681 [Pavlovales sp. CCMP2436]|nr:hypothetical protein T492DRAFT_875681 [Pavlovales sp. CCMP2436]